VTQENLYVPNKMKFGSLMKGRYHPSYGIIVMVLRYGFALSHTASIVRRKVNALGS
jgi:hypothetical protein